MAYGLQCGLQDLGNASDEQTPKGGKGAVAQILDFLLPDSTEEAANTPKVIVGAQRVLLGYSGLKPFVLFLKAVFCPAWSMSAQGE